MAEVKMNEVFGSIFRELTKGLDKDTRKELADIVFDFIEAKTQNKTMLFLIASGRSLLKIEDEEWGLDKKTK